MANPEHLAILKQGVEAWNAWRTHEFRKEELEVSQVLPDLSEADLSGEDLAWANLWNADLQQSNLRNANLSFTNLGTAMLFGTCLEGATLFEANLIGALLWQADLRRADLSRANLAGTNVTGADFTGAKLSRTCLAHIDLSNALGLSKVRHGGPSTVGTDTLALSRGRIAAGFLKGCGLSDWEIGSVGRSAPGSSPNAAVDSSYDVAQLRHEGTAIDFYTCFISYSHKDRLFARRLHDHLQGRGIRCGYDEKNLKPGDRILDVIGNAIRDHDKLLICCSEASLQSWWVKDEIMKALEREQKEDRDILIPLDLDGSFLEWQDGLATQLRSRLAADFTGWEQDNAKFEAEFERVVEALRA